MSLVAVFVAAKAYLLLTLPDQPDEQLAASIKAKNIELFAVNEEEDPLYNKFKEVSQPNNPLMTEDIETTENSDEVLYTPEEDDDDGIVSENKTPSDTENEDIALADGDDLEIADASELPETTPETEAESNNSSDDDNDDDMQIADAAQAPMFTIPLKHNYNIEGGTVTVSDATDNGKIALASHDVSVYNLGTENQADVTEPLSERAEENEEETVSETETSTAQSSELAANVASPQTSDDDPWEVAEVANKHAPKNSLSVKSQPETADVALPAQETQVAYRPQQNILIPIPDEIMQEENLTPQFSSSKENLQLEEELRSQNKLPPADKDGNTGSATGGKNDASGTSGTSGNNSGTQAPAGSDGDAPKIEIRPLPAQIPADDTEKDFDEQNESNADDSSSKSLTDSITAWFSGVKTKASNLTKGSSDKSGSKDDEQETAEGKKSGGSIFQKLLGPQEEEKNIAPSELKITFQPNKAEISGQTLEWLRAFADNTVKNDTVVVEIRASQSAPQAIQQKRLKLFYKLLADRGVDYHKINIIFTNREPNSFIIRNVRYASEEDMAKAVVKWGDNPW
ncbi:MAG: hypothetical protein IKR92_01200 [Alphaproteobacteria bacterium]|nr:hypothetical protein [Alphaproteobacteria bacterium]